MAAPPRQSAIYKGWDVHSYTPESVAFLKALEETSPDVHTFLHRPVPPRLLKKLESAWPDTLVGVLRKWHERSDTVAPDALYYKDPDLDGINIWALALLTLEASTANSATLEPLFWEMVTDAGTTCIQGDSHRLLMLYISLVQGNTTHIPPS